MAAGVLLRIWEYLEFRVPFQDERYLLNSLVGRGIFDFHRVLENNQMAPPGFLMIERFMVRLPVDFRASGRLFPLFCGIASMFLMRKVAQAYLSNRAVPIAVALLAMNDYALYHSSDIKQYSSDLMTALAALLLAAPSPPAKRNTERSRLLAVFGLVAPWFSFSAIFVLAGVGIHRVFVQLFRKDWRKAGLIAGIGLTWLLSFSGCIWLSRSIQSTDDFLQRWWGFAFLPLPPRSQTDLSLLIETLANVFINPGGIMTALSLPYTAVLASVLALLGCLALGLRWPGGLWLAASPLLFGLVASGLHQYPFHGRLLFYVVPTFLLLLAEGMAFIGGPRGWPITLLLAGFFLYGGAGEVLWYKTIQYRVRPVDSHADLKNDLLDDLERRRAPEAPHSPTKRQVRESEDQ